MRHDLILFSDHHANNHTYGATKELWKDSNLHNSRLLDSVRVLYEISDYVKQHDEIDCVIFGGDLFHKRNIFNTDVFNLTFKAIQDMAKKRVYMIPGNHDFGNRAGTLHSLQPFDAIDNVVVVDTPQSYDVLGDLYISFIPYSDTREQTVNGFNKCLDDIQNAGEHCILVGHCGIQGAKVGADYVLVHEGDISLDDIPYNSYDACFFGHYHRHQKLCDNAWYIGATHQHNWGDVGCTRGFLHVTLEDHKVTVKQIPTSAPQFRVLTDKDKGDYSKDFVRIISSAKTDAQREKINGKLHNPKKLEIISEPEETEEAKIELPEDVLSPTKMIKAWAQKFSDPELAERIGLELLTQVGE